MRIARCVVCNVNILPEEINWPSSDGKAKLSLLLLLHHRNLSCCSSHFNNLRSWSIQAAKEETCSEPVHLWRLNFGCGEQQLHQHNNSWPSKLLALWRNLLQVPHRKIFRWPFGIGLHGWGFDFANLFVMSLFVGCTNPFFG